MKETLIGIAVRAIAEGLGNVFGPEGRERRKKRRARRKARRAERKAKRNQK